MFRYEILFLATPEITTDESEGIKSHFSSVIRSHKGDMLSFEKWGKYRLAYPVNRNEYGVYFLTRFDVNSENKNELIASLKEAFVFKFNTVVMKNMFSKLDSEASLDYRRPDSLEDTPQDVDLILKKNEMKGLLKKGPARKNVEGNQAAEGSEEVANTEDTNQEIKENDEEN